MRTATKIFLLGILSVFVLVHCEEENNEVGETLPEALQDLQTEFWLPYSVTEDVDFSIVRPEAYGCYQWYEKRLPSYLLHLTKYSLIFSIKFT